MSSTAVSGSAAGACAKVCVYPLDVLKKRLQIRGFEEARQQFGKVSVFFFFSVVHFMLFCFLVQYRS